MSITEQLQGIVDTAARSGALTPEAIRQFDEMRKRVEELEESVASKSRQIESLDATKRDMALTNTKIGGEREQLQRRVTELETLKAGAEKAVWVADFERRRREEMRGILHDVFRNTEVSRSIMRSHVVPYSGGGAGMQSSSDHETETRA